MSDKPTIQEWLDRMSPEEKREMSAKFLEECSKPNPLLKALLDARPWYVKATQRFRPRFVSERQIGPESYVTTESRHLLHFLWWMADRIYRWDRTRNGLNKISGQRIEVKLKGKP